MYFRAASKTPETAAGPVLRGRDGMVWCALTSSALASKVMDVVTNCASVRTHTEVPQHMFVSGLNSIFTS
jgi:hypothetical protein